MVYLYLDEQAKVAQSPVNLLAALWRQLSAENRSLEDIENLYERHSKAATRPQLEEVSRLLRAELCKYTQTFVIVDAFDECPEHDGIRDTLLKELSLLPGSVNILFTARNPPLICDYFPNVVLMEIRALRSKMLQSTSRGRCHNYTIASERTLPYNRLLQTLSSMPSTECKTK